jgi:hypothetical protein
MSLDVHLPQEVVREVLAPWAIESIDSFSGGGLSGAKVWKCVSSVHGPLCLRQWPTGHPTHERLMFIHAAMRRARTAGLDFVPRLYEDNHQSFRELGGHFWEVTQWMPGRADYAQNPQPEKLTAAIDSLANLHRVWSGGISKFDSASPAVNQRAEMLSYWLGQRDLVVKVHQYVRGLEEADLCLKTIHLLQLHGPPLLREIQKLQMQPVQQHPVLRDVWSDHVLFEGQQVKGIIDYGAVKIDEPATDLARMLGSFEPFNQEARRQAVLRYNAQNAQGQVSWQRVELLDQTAALLTALQWMQWLVLERRSFAAELSGLFERWRTAICRLAAWH